MVGSGPAGLAVATQLRSAGHTVTVWEASSAPGGLLRYGIPEFKLEKSIVDRRLGILEAQGISFCCGVHVGEGQTTWEKLTSDFDAVVVAIGSEVPRDLPVPGRNLDGVVFAMDYLVDQNKSLETSATANQQSTSLQSTATCVPTINAHYKHVVVIGGGDTGSDCLGTALRQGATSVTQIELMPKPSAKRNPKNPWPHWPRIFRVSSSPKRRWSKDLWVSDRKVCQQERGPKW